MPTRCETDAPSRLSQCWIARQRIFKTSFPTTRPPGPTCFGPSESHTLAWGYTTKRFRCMSSPAIYSPSRRRKKLQNTARGGECGPSLRRNRACERGDLAARRNDSARDGQSGAGGPNLSYVERPRDRVPKSQPYRRRRSARRRGSQGSESQIGTGRSRHTDVRDQLGGSL